MSSPALSSAGEDLVLGVMMKRQGVLYGLLILLALAAAIGTNVAKIDYWQNKFDYQTAINEEQSRQIKELQKEVRILKTDIYIIQYGFREAE